MGQLNIVESFQNKGKNDYITFLVEKLDVHELIHTYCTQYVNCYDFGNNEREILGYPGLFTVWI